MDKRNNLQGFGQLTLHWHPRCEVMQKGSGPVQCRCRRCEDVGLTTVAELSIYQLYRNQQACH